MPITYDAVRALSAELYDRSLRKVPDDTLAALAAAGRVETSPTGQRTLVFMRDSARTASTHDRFVCSDAGVPSFHVTIGTAARLQGPIRRAFVDGFADLVARIDPPLLAHVTNPLTLERGHAGRNMPLVSFDLLDDADHVEIVCSPKALGSGRWAALETFSFPSVAQIEDYVIDAVVAAGSQPCPPVVVGVGVGGTFDHAAKLAALATLRPIGTRSADADVAAMEARLLARVNALGFGPMGTGGDATAYAVHVDTSAGHGYTPVAVAFNCWINRRTRARIYDDGRIERLE
ncbi:MAG: fumarate hydratase [Lautropia sp.]